MKLKDFLRYAHKHGMIAGPNTDGYAIGKIKCRIGFEPHGKASETWEEEWILEIPWVQWHCRRIGYWEKGTSEKHMSFRGRTIDEVIHKGAAFLKETYDQGIRLAWNQE